MSSNARAGRRRPTRRNEHQRDVLGLARDQIFVSDVRDVFGDVLLDARDRQFALVVGRRAARSAVIASSGNLASMIKRAGIRHEDRAIRPRLVRQRVLKFIGALRQHVGDDRFQLALAEGAARLLVGEHVLQRSHLRGQIGDVLLRAVDHRQPRMQLLQVIGGVLGRGLHRLAEVLRHRVEPRVHGLLQLRLRVVPATAHGLEPGIEFGQPLLGRRVRRRARGRSSSTMMATTPAAMTRARTMSRVSGMGSSRVALLLA